MISIIDRIFEPCRLSIENGYDRFVLNYFGNNFFVEQMVMNTLCTVVVYMVAGLALLIVDLTEKPKFIYRYKIQPTSQVPNENLQKVLRVVMLNHGMTVLSSVVFIGIKSLFYTRQLHFPTFSRLLFEWAVFFICREIAFYYSHRLLHHPSIYRHFHKQHHEWQTPIAITAIYCHPVEHALSNIIPLSIGPLLLNSHNFLFQIWLVYAILLTLNFHSGYHFPGFFSPVFHDFHHLKFNCNYGIFGFFDWLHGTDQAFRRSPYFHQHQFYFSLNPPKWTEKN